MQMSHSRTRQLGTYFMYRLRTLSAVNTEAPGRNDLHNRLKTALCCQAICFVKITNMDRLRRHVHVPYDIESEIRGADLI